MTDHHITPVAQPMASAIEARAYDEARCGPLTASRLAQALSRAVPTAGCHNPEHFIIAGFRRAGYTGPTGSVAEIEPTLGSWLARRDALRNRHHAALNAVRAANSTVDTLRRQLAQAEQAVTDAVSAERALADALSFAEARIPVVADACVDCDTNPETIWRRSQRNLIVDRRGSGDQNLVAPPMPSVG